MSDSYKPRMIEKLIDLEGKTWRFYVDRTLPEEEQMKLCLSLIENYPDYAKLKHKNKLKTQESQACQLE